MVADELSVDIREDTGVQILGTEFQGRGFWAQRSAILMD